MRNTLIFAQLSVFGLLGSAQASESLFNTPLNEGYGHIARQMRNVVISAGNQQAAAQAGASTYTAECWRKHIDYQGTKFNYPLCASLGHSERLKKERNPWVEQQWLDSIFLQSIDHASFDGTPLQAEVLQAVSAAAADSRAASLDRNYVAGLFDLLRLATVPQEDPNLARRRVNAAVKTRWFLIVQYGKMCEKYRDVCYSKYFGDFYAIAKHDWSPRTRITAMSLIYFLESDRAKRRSALEEMSVRDGESLFSVEANGSSSYSSHPNDNNRAFAGFLLNSGPATGDRSWACFADSLRWDGGSRISLYSSATSGCK